jgi:2-polyprenyl-6-methoxyphenol hydroxylase-like FAD-dependent oxidoreductase
MTQQPISIIGAGIGGLTLARCLLKRGIPAVVYERRPSLPCYSYGITLHASSYAPLLKILNIDEATFKRHTAVDSTIGGSGTIDSLALIRPEDIDVDSYRAHREKLERLLRRGLTIQWDHALSAVETGPSGVSLYFKGASGAKGGRGGQAVERRCVVGVDGPHSTLRTSLSPNNTSLSVLPFVAFNGKRSVKDSLFDKLYARHMKEDGTIIELKRGDTVMRISINERLLDHVSVSWVYSRPARGEEDALYKPNRPTSGATDIPAALYEEIGALGKLPQPFMEVFDKGKVKGDRVLAWLMRSVRFPLAELQELGKKGVFFMGDAVDAEPIIGGSGANAAIRDGVSLAECIATSGTEGIPAWYDARYADWETGIRQSKIALEEMHRSKQSRRSERRSVEVEAVTS